MRKPIFGVLYMIVDQIDFDLPRNVLPIEFVWRSVGVRTHAKDEMTGLAKI